MTVDEIIDIQLDLHLNVKQTRGLAKTLVKQAKVNEIGEIGAESALTVAAAKPKE